MRFNWTPNSNDWGNSNIRVRTPMTNIIFWEGAIYHMLVINLSINEELGFRACY